MVIMVGVAKFGFQSGKNTKGNIVQALSEEWPLTAKQLHNALKRRYSSASTYQAVHKAAKELVEEGVLQKIDGKLRKEANELFEGKVGG